jgi:hypothetical protein
MFGYELTNINNHVVLPFDEALLSVQFNYL